MRIKAISFFSLVALVVLFGAGAVRGQIIGDIGANIPFPFYAGDAKFPAGHYVIRPLNGTDLTVMEIATPDGRDSAVFEVRQSRDNIKPRTTELIFDKYGDRYFLSKLYDQGSRAGSAVVESRYETKFAATGASHEERHIAARHERK